MTIAVLDASALLALLRSEPGAGRVQAALPDAAMSTVNLAEVVGHFARNGAAEGEIREVLQPLPIELVAFTGELATVAGLLAPLTRPAGLSLGDRACLALARQLNVRALTADRSWQGLAGPLGIAIDLIR